MPPNPAPEITNLLMRVGPTMGDTPVTAQELTAWAKGAGVSLSCWEFETLTHLSHAYLSQQLRARSVTCPAPWQAVTDKREVSSHVRAVLRA